MKMKMVVMSVLVAIFLVGCQQKTEFETCIEFLEKAQGGKAENYPQAVDWAILCAGKVS